MAKGQKTGGRKAGTPNKATSEIKAVAREYGPKAVAKLAELAGLVDGTAAAESEQARIAALNAILDRGYGKATQPLSGDDDKPPIQVEHGATNDLVSRISRLASRK